MNKLTERAVLGTSSRALVDARMTISHSQVSRVSQIMNFICLDAFTLESKAALLKKKML